MAVCEFSSCRVHGAHGHVAYRGLAGIRWRRRALGF